MQTALIDIVPKVMLKTIDKYVAFTDFEFTDETLESLKYYHSVFDPTIDEKEITKQFANCCETGQLKVLKWLASRFVIDLLRDSKYGIIATNLAYYNGHEHVLVWLRGMFGWSFYKDYGKMDLTSACEYGMLDLVKNIIKRGKLSIKDITYGNNMVFKRACVCKHYDIAEWLEETYEVIKKSDCINDLYDDLLFELGNDQLPTWIDNKINLLT